MVNDEHYKELRSVIESLPDWTTLNEAKKCEEEPSDVESEFETEMGSEITDSDDEDGDEEDEEEDEEEEDEAEDVQDEGPCEQIDVVAGERTFEPFSTTNEPNRSKNESKFEHDTSNVLRTNDSLITNDEDTTMMMKSFKFRTDNSNITIDTVQLTSDAKSILTLDVMDTSNLTKSASNPTIAKDDYRAHVSPTGNSVVINLNTELSKAFGEGSLLPLHRHVSQQPDNVHVTTFHTSLQLL